MGVHGSRTGSSKVIRYTLYQGCIRGVIVQEDVEAPYSEVTRIRLFHTHTHPLTANNVTYDASLDPH